MSPACQIYQCLRSSYWNTLLHTSPAACCWFVSVLNLGEYFETLVCMAALYGRWKRSSPPSASGSVGGLPSEGLQARTGPGGGEGGFASC